MGIDDNEPRKLYVGTAGAKFFTIIMPPIPVVSKSLFIDRSNDAYGDPQNPGIGLKYSGKPYSMNAFDYDNDGDKDLLVTQRDVGAVLYQMGISSVDGVPAYFKMSSQIPLYPEGYRGCVAADISNDIDVANEGMGRTDVFLAHEEHAKVLKNTGIYNEQIFEDVSTQTSIEPLIQDSWCGAWGDYDRDGRLDLVIGRGGGSHQDPMSGNHDIMGMPNTVLHNTTLDGVVTFEDVSSGILNNPNDDLTATVSTSWADVNNDGEIDLMVGDIGQHATINNYTALYINQGDGSFIDSTSSCLNMWWMPWVGGVSWVDHNADGFLDLVSGSNQVSLLSLNNGSGELEPFVALMGIGSNWQSSVIPVDVDLDNYPDYMCLPSYSGAHGALVRSVPEVGGGSSLVNVTSLMGLSFGSDITACVATDLTADGDPDLLMGDITYANSEYGKFYFQNTDLFGGEMPAHGWYGIHLIGDGGTNKSAIGASVSVTIDGRIVKRVVDGGSGLGGQGSTELIFGASSVDDESSVLIATITWPDGYEQQQVLSYNVIVTAYDNSAPGAVTGTLTTSVIAHPGMMADWIIEWETPYSSDPNKDEVYVDYTGSRPSCDFGTFTLTPNTAGVSISVLPIAGGGYHHKMIWSNTLCVAGCTYDISAASATWNQDGTLRKSSALGRYGTTHLPLSVNVCLEDDPEMEGL